MTTEFLLTAFIVVLLPGTGVLYTLATGLGMGARASVVAALGCTLGIVPQLLLATFGLSTIFHASSFAFHMLKIVGTLYLLYMGWQVLRGDGVLTIEPNRKDRSDQQIIGTGIWLNLLNPKLGVFFLAFLPQFVPAGMESARVAFFVLGLVFVAMTLVTFIGYGLLASWVRDYVITKPSVMATIRWAFAVAFLLLGLRLGFDAWV
ncbi:LysE family transporter [Aureimonas ureilytica]|uniref:LysE family transporter n=1 Tax=Aureimonas ureilytica TaxID=401562 RepID=A0A175RW39_9HYPH|nr:LysE family translocator [Aureimonas ureilytica]KTR07089.1 LysE family transporter [Aureimonas ureilytica]